MSEAKINLQNQPKVAEFLQCYVADPGHKIVYMDFSSLEPHVCTFYSRDEKMMSLYGPDAKRNDIYLFFGANTKVYGDTIRATGYDPDNPTPETIKAAKTHCEAIRDVLKTVVLGCNYGMGYKLLHSYVNQAGYPLSMSDAGIIHRDYWEFFGGIKKFEEALLSQYYSNGGYIINGRGRPITVAYAKLKDIVNRFVQSTGHDILMHYLLLLNNVRHEEGLSSFRPWFPDEHDATIWQAADHEVPAAQDAFKEALRRLNHVLVNEDGWDITFSGDIKTGNNMAVKL